MCEPTLTKNDLSVELLKALGKLEDREREHWIDRHFLGQGTKGGNEASYVRKASEKLAGLLRLER